METLFPWQRTQPLGPNILEGELEAIENNLKDSSGSIKAKDKELLKLRKDESEAVQSFETEQN